MNTNDNLIDSEVFAQVMEILKETFPETVDVFFKQNQLKLALLHEALGKNDFQKLKDTGHQLKSSSANFGFTRLSNLCRELEKNSDNLSKNELSELIQKIETTFFDTKSALDNR